MKTRHLIVTFLCVILGAATTQAAVAGEHDAILGNWTTAKGKSTVNLYQCGNKVCGKITALKEPTYPADDGKGMAGKTKVDRENPEEKLRDKPLIGLVILEGFDRTEDGLWKNGTVYDPENGKTYKCKMTLESDKVLKVRGFIGFALLGRTSVWTR